MDKKFVKQTALFIVGTLAFVIFAVVFATTAL